MDAGVIISKSLSLPDETGDKIETKHTPPYRKKNYVFNDRPPYTSHLLKNL